MTGGVAKRALVVGGGGPTGSLVVNGLIERGHKVSVLNTGRHPVPFAGDVEQITADPHFIEPLEEALSGRTFDIAVAQYGRLRLVAQALAGRVGHFVAIGGVFYPGWIDEAATTRPTSETGVARDWKVTYRDEALPVTEDVPLEPVGKMGQRVVETDGDIRARHARGDFVATLLRYPRVYGPRQPGAAEWSIIRRILDGRRQILVPDGGFLLNSVLYAENAARIVLAVVDNPDVSGGEIFNCADLEPITQRKWIKLIAGAMSTSVDLVSVPVEMAKPTWPYARFPQTFGHHILNTEKLMCLSYVAVPVEEGMRKTVAWYLEAPRERGGATESQLRDAFAYELEDRIIAEMARARTAIDALDIPDPDLAHPYAHPVKPEGKT